MCDARRDALVGSVHLPIQFRRGDDFGGFAFDLDDGVVVDFFGGHVELVGGFFEVDHAGDGVAAALDVGFDFAGFGVVVAGETAVVGFAVEADSLGEAHGQERAVESEIGALDGGGMVGGVVFAFFGEFGFEGVGHDVHDSVAGLHVDGIPLMPDPDGAEVEDQADEQEDGDDDAGDDHAGGDVHGGVVLRFGGGGGAGLGAFG